MNFLKNIFCYRYSVADLLPIYFGWRFINDGTLIGFGIGFLIILLGIILTELIKTFLLDKDES